MRVPVVCKKLPGMMTAIPRLLGFFFFLWLIVTKEYREGDSRYLIGHIPPVTLPPNPSLNILFY